MTVLRNREEAAQAAEATTTNVPRFCQGQTRAWFNSPSVGDVDHDDASDAEDGWKSEPEQYRHYGDRRPPRGVPVSFLGGRNDNGHRAMSLGEGRIRSTDFDTATQTYRAGVCGTAYSADVLEREMGVSYVGWSDTIGGELIPLPPVPQTRGEKVDAAIDDLKVAAQRAKDGGKRDSLIKQALKSLRKLSTWDRRRK